MDEERKRRLKTGVWGGFALLLALMLSTYNEADPSYNLAADVPVHNWLGWPGAYFADPLLQAIGFGAVLLVILPFCRAIRCGLEQPVNWRWLRGVSAFLSLIATCVLFSFISASETWPFYVGYGGYVGDALASLFRAHMQEAYIPWLMGSVLLVTLPAASTLTWGELWFAVRYVAWMVSVAAYWVAEAVRFVVDIVGKCRRSEEYEEEEGEVSIVKKEPKLARPKKKQHRPRQETFHFNEEGEYVLPGLELLQEVDIRKAKSASDSALSQNAKLLKNILEDFGVKGEITGIRPGPVVTLYELEPSPGTKSSRVIGLSDDIARSMSAVSARIAVIPGRNAIGIELPNITRETVYLRELIETTEFQDERMALPIALGKDIGGETVITDLARMPHLLVAGTTGSGKSVAVNAMILSLLYRLSPEECRLILIDPKMLELSVYDGIPHLLSPVVTEPGKAIVALKWAVKEMESRYRLMSQLGVRNVAGYNKRIAEAIRKKEKLERTVQTGFDPETGAPIMETVPLEMKKLPFIVVVVDEMADLMLVAGKDIEASIQRLAQMARAAGIHIVMATQRPSVDVITGVIKANFPTRISFQVTSRIDSRTILGEQGAEQLLGMGDMLYMASGGRITRIHGPFVDDKEVEKVVAYLKRQGEPEYIEEVTQDEEAGFVEGDEEDGGDLYDQAVRIVTSEGRASTSYIQRQLKIGYNRAADLIDRMEKEGVISAPNHAGKREVLVG